MICFERSDSVGWFAFGAGSGMKGLATRFGAHRDSYVDVSPLD